MDVNNPLTTQQITNPLLTKVQIPGKEFALPSGGVLYTNDELAPNIENGEVHVHPLSAISEIKIKNPDLLFSGRAFDEVIRECVPSILKPMELYGKDVDAVMCFIRIATYGDNFEITANHGCENGKDHPYDVSIQQIVNEMKALDPSKIDEEYTVEFANGQKAKLEPVRLRHVVKLLQTATTSKGQAPTPEEIQENLMDNLLNMIQDVDGITDKALIAEWIKSVPTTFISKIGDKLEGANKWGPSFDRKVGCKDCGQEFVVELPVNPITFFSE